MHEAFDLPVSYKGKEMLFSTRLIVTGFTHKFALAVNGVEVLFEPDEERNYRAVLDISNQHKKVDIALLQEIARAIEELVK